MGDSMCRVGHKLIRSLIKFSRIFVATASRILRPNTVYRVNIVLLPESADLVVKAVITKDSGQHIASGVQVTNAGSSHDILLKVSGLFIEI